MNGKSRAIAVLAIVGAWYVSALFVSLRPQFDHVPTGMVNNVKTAQAVRCSGAFSSDASLAGSLPELPAGRAYERVACESMRGDFRKVIIFDTVVLALAGLAAWRYNRRRQPLPPRVSETPLRDAHHPAGDLERTSA